MAATNENATFEEAENMVKLRNLDETSIAVRPPARACWPKDKRAGRADSGAHSRTLRV